MVNSTGGSSAGATIIGGRKAITNVANTMTKRWMRTEATNAATAFRRYSSRQVASVAELMRAGSCSCVRDETNIAEHNRHTIRTDDLKTSPTQEVKSWAYAWREGSVQSKYPREPRQVVRMQRAIRSSRLCVPRRASDRADPRATAVGLSLEGVEIDLPGCDGDCGVREGFLRGSQAWHSRSSLSVVFASRDAGGKAFTSEPGIWSP